MKALEAVTPEKRFDIRISQAKNIIEMQMRLLGDVIGGLTNRPGPIPGRKHRIESEERRRK